MKKIIVHAPYDVRLDDAPSVERELGEYELFVRTELSALSPGTEKRIYTGTDAERFSYRVHYPFELGYNNVGRVIAVGSRVTEYQVGQRIFSRLLHQSEYIVAERVAKPIVRADATNVPPSYDVIAPVPQSVKSEHAALTHLWVLGLNALHRGNFRVGENVGVIGLGVVGLGAVSMAHIAGARVAAIGNAESRLHVARRMGADAVWLNGDADVERAEKFCGEAGIDLVIVCADSWNALQTAVQIARRNTRIAILAFPGVGQGQPSFDPFAPADFYNKSISFIGVAWMASDDYPPEYQRFTVKRMYRYVLDLMAQRRIDLSPIVTHRIPIAQMQKGFDLATSRDKSALGIIFDWS